MFSASTSHIDKHYEHIHPHCYFQPSLIKHINLHRCLYNLVQDIPYCIGFKQMKIIAVYTQLKQLRNKA